MGKGLRGQGRKVRALSSVILLFLILLFVYFLFMRDGSEPTSSTEEKIVQTTRTEVPALSQVEGSQASPEFSRRVEGSQAGPELPRKVEGPVLSGVEGPVLSGARPELSRRVEGPVQAIESPASLRDKAGKAKESEALSFADLERKALSDPNPEERIEALDELTEEKNRKGAARVLIQVLQSDKDAEVRRAALEGLEEIEAISLEVLSQTALNDPEASLRVRAIELMGDRDEKGKQTIDLLKRIAKIDQSKEVREAAIELLEEMGMGN